MFGFTFCGKHSSEYGTVYKSDTRALLPPIRRSTIQIPRRSGVYDATGKVWDERAETITCFARRMPGYASMKEQVREIAYWLSGKGTLTFDDEPDRHYTTRIIGQATVEVMPHYAVFTIELAINPPFALSDAKTVAITDGENAAGYNGTVERGCVIEIRNPNDFDVSNITITTQTRR